MVVTCILLKMQVWVRWPCLTIVGWMLTEWHLLLEAFIMDRALSSTTRVRSMLAEYTLMVRNSLVLQHQEHMQSSSLAVCWLVRVVTWRLLETFISTGILPTSTTIRVSRIITQPWIMVIHLWVLWRGRISTLSTRQMLPSPFLVVTVQVMVIMIQVRCLHKLFLVLLPCGLMPSRIRPLVTMIWMTW